MMNRLIAVYFLTFFLSYQQPINKMHTDSNQEVGKLINYFENCIFDLNKDFIQNSKSNHQRQMHTTSQNVSNLSVSYANTLQPGSTTLLTVINKQQRIGQTIPDRTFSEDMYDRLTYQTLINTDSCSSHEQLTPPSIKNAKRRYAFHYHTNKKRLTSRRPPTYIKELKAYLAQRESSLNDIVKISDVKKFRNVLVWLSNQTTSPSLIKTDNLNNNTNGHSSSITTDSVITATQDISHSYSGVMMLFLVFITPFI